MNLTPQINSIQFKISNLRKLLSKDVINSVEELIKQENFGLEKRVAELKEQICMTEMLLGFKQYCLPPKTVVPDVNSSIMNGYMSPADELNTPVAAKVEEAPWKQDCQSTVKPKTSTESAKNKGDSKGGGAKASAASDAPVDVGRLDMRVGRILEVARHPDADALYVEKVDVGDGRIRTVVSGLVKFCPLEALQDRVGIFMCNLKPVKMRGVESEAMLMCASAPDAGGVEPLILETGADVQLGDAVVVDGFNYNPDAQLNPKKKIFEQVKPDLRVDLSGFACYRGTRWTLKSKPGVSIKASTLRDVQIA